MHRLLHLQPHKHTGKLLPHRHTSHRMLALVIVLCGGVMGWTMGQLQQIAQADDLLVTASIPAPIPTEPAVIEHPADGTVTADPTVVVSGTCPQISPPVSVVLMGNGAFLGSTPCDNGHFELTITLAPGTTELVARTLTITGDYGPDSTPVHVTYRPIVGLPANLPPISARASTSGACPADVKPLAIESRVQFILFGPGRDALWQGAITGGCQFYRLQIDWGDGKVESFRELDSRELSYSHHYSRMQSYTVTLRVTDAANAQISLMIAAGTAFVSSSTTIFTPPPEIPIATWIALYGAYLTVLSLLGFSWLAGHDVRFLRFLRPVPVVVHRPHKPRARSRQAAARRRRR